MTFPPGAPPAAAGPQGKKPRNRKMLVYAGVAGALLLMVLLTRRGSAQAQSDPNAAGSGALTPVASPAADGTASGVDNASQLAGFENAILDQLPSAIQSGVAAGLANQLPSAGGGDTASGSASGAGEGGETTSDLLTALAAFNESQRGTGLSGEQTGGGSGKKTATKTHKKAAKHPASTKSHGSKGGGSHKQPKRPARGHTKARSGGGGGGYSGSPAKPHISNRPTGRAHKRHG